MMVGKCKRQVRKDTFSKQDWQDAGGGTMMAGGGRKRHGMDKALRVGGGVSCLRCR